MRQSEMNQEQLARRSLFVDTLTAAGWRSSNNNRNFDNGLWVSPEASLSYSNPDMTLIFELALDDPRAILHLDAKGGRTLGLVFKCVDRLKDLLNAVVAMQNDISPDNVKNTSTNLLAVCPEMFKISASGDKLIPVKAPKGGR
jgi:hypothetical protein